MTAKLIIGLTGGIGSGKTAASDWFAIQGITIVDADIVAREVVEPDQPALAEIVAHFGANILLKDGWLNRPALRQRVFSDPAARHILEAITHPRIRQRMIEQLQQAQSSYAMLVSPLLLESTQHELVNRILLIDADEQVQLHRAGLRDGQSPQAVQRIIAAQMPRAERLKRADDIVTNHGDMADLYAQLVPLHQTYFSMASGVVDQQQ
jgi:dephospho-CoA kinase